MGKADVYDGSVWKGNPECSNEHSIFFCVGLDGLKPFKSSSQAVWPVLLSCLNLPPKLRFRTEHLFPVVVANGSFADYLDLVLEPMVREFKAAANGTVQHPFPSCGAQARFY
jgi:hypothetical protein